jgi:DNA-directed RNA polymerase subunit RPC12/RpoP
MTATLPPLTNRPDVPIDRVRSPRPNRTSTTGRRRRRGADVGLVTGADGTPGPSVTCVFCHESIEFRSFGTGEQHTRTASCPNCGLRVSVTDAVWARWCAAGKVTSAEQSLGERLRARRVATAAQLILEQVALSADAGTDGPTP